MVMVSTRFSPLETELIDLNDLTKTQWEQITELAIRIKNSPDKYAENRAPVFQIPAKTNGQMVEIADLAGQGGHRLPS